MSSHSYVFVWQVVQRNTKFWWTSSITFPRLFWSLDPGTLKVADISHVIPSTCNMEFLTRQTIFLIHPSEICKFIKQCYGWIFRGHASPGLVSICSSNDISGRWQRKWLSLNKFIDKHHEAECLKLAKKCHWLENIGLTWTISLFNRLQKTSISH